MTQLTRKEIIELRARAIFKARKPTATWEQWDPEPYYEQAQATIEADEKAGVLMLVEEGDLKDGDWADISEGETYYNMRTPAKVRQVREDKDYFDIGVRGLSYFYNKIAEFPDKIKNDIKVIRRANTPVYQTRKE